MKYQYKKLKCSQIISEVLQDLNLNISVNYYPDYQIKENLRTHGQIMFFSAIGDEAERKSYKSLSPAEQDSFVTKSPCIHFPHLTVFNLIELLKSDEGTVYEETRNTANNVKMQAACSLEVRCLLFIFLHEVGHWNQLMNDFHGRVKEYSDTDLEEEKRLHDEQNELQRRITGRRPTQQEKQTMKRFQEEYRQIPKEKYANMFAEKKMSEISAKVLGKF